VTTRAHAIGTALLLTALAPTPALAQDAPREHTLHYEASFGQARVARASLSLSCPTTHLATLSARTLALAEQLHPLRLRLDSSTPPGADTPTRARTTIVEEGRARSYDSALSDDGVWTQATLDGRARDARHTPLGRPAHDLLSWALALGRDVAAGQALSPILVWDGWKRAVLTPGAPERVRLITPAGVADAWRVELTRTRLDRPDAPPAPYGTVYFGDDALPLGVDLQTPIGATQVRLAARTTRACE
jgi:hypothetical protein